MLDKNGVEIRTGGVVRISGAFFKNDNGLYYVENSPGDPSWCGSDHSLRKICRSGKLSTAKHNICFWPIAVFVSDRCKAAEASRWNKANAEIEVVRLPSTAEIVAHFLGEAQGLDRQIERRSWDWGEDHPEVERLRVLQAHYYAVAARVQEAAE